jgi:nicotinamidase-related amidase
MTELDFLRRDIRVGTLVLNGYLADCCVLNTTRNASNLGYRVMAAGHVMAGTNP